MKELPFHSDRKLTDVLREKHFTLSAEIIPPRNGSERQRVLEQIQTITDAGAQFLAVTKGSGGSLRGGSLPIAQVVKESFSIPAIAHFTCRDLTPQEVENSLIDHHYFGIRNILALRGDPPEGHKEWKSREGGYSYAYQLIRQIHALNQGEYLYRPGGPERDGFEKTDFCIGAAAYPEFPDPKARIEYFRLKKEAGAHFGMTDMLFDADVYARFVEDCAKAGCTIPILPGTRILKSKAQVRKMMARFPVTVPPETIAALPDDIPRNAGPEAEEAGIEQFLKLVEKLRASGAPGIHLFVISDMEGVVSALKRFMPSPSRI